MSDARRSGGHIPWAKVDARLRSAREFWIATASPTGRPDVTPVWFWWDGEAAFFTTAAVSRKARNIAHEPEVVLHNGDGADPIILKGKAEPVLAPEELRLVDEAYRQKYVDPHSGTPATIFVADDHVYRVTVRLVTAWEYATCSTRTDWEFESTSVAAATPA